MTFLNPRIKKARLHRITTSSGHILEIGWHFGRQLYCVSIYHPEKAKDPDNWNPETQFFGTTPRQVLSDARLKIAEEINPDIREVRERVVGKETLTFEAIKQAQKQMMLGIGYGMKSNPKFFMNSKQYEILKKKLGELPASPAMQAGIDLHTVVFDELENSAIWASDAIDSFTYLTKSLKLNKP